MNSKVFAGSVIAFLYNGFVGRLPSRTLRSAFLRIYLARFGSGTGIQMGCQFLNGRKISLGDRNVINFGCLLDGRRHAIRTGADVSIGPEASILTLGHDPRSVNFEDKGGEVDIGDRVWIGYRAMVLPGVKLGEGSVVGAGAVVTKNVEPYAVVVGVPAKKVADRPKEINYKLYHNPFLV